MKKTYQQPVVEVEELVMERPFAASDPDKKVFNEVHATDRGVRYGGGGSGTARSGESELWDDDSNWDNL